MRARYLLPLLGVTLIISNMGLTAYGICYPELRRVADREIILRAAEQRLSGIRDTDPEKYAALKQSIVENPGCCTVERLYNVEGGSNSIFAKVGRMLVGYSVSTVALNYELHDGESRDVDLFAVSACGQVLD